MKALTLLILTFSISGLRACGAQSAVVGEWVGGSEINGNFTPLKVQFRAVQGGVAGTIRPTAGFNWQSPSVDLEQVRFNPPVVHFEWGGATPLVFEGELNEGVVKGAITFGPQKGTFYLIRSTTPNTEVLAQYVGEYQLGKGSYVSVQPPPSGEPTAAITYTVHDLASPNHRNGELFPVSDSTFVAGPGRWMPYPVEITATFMRNKKGQVTALKWSLEGAPAIIAKKVTPHLYNDEEVTFSNGDVKLAGTVSTPVKKGRHPAVLLIAGSDPNTRTRGLPQFFAEHGIVALSYDKRGNGASTGVFRGVTVEQLAGDAAAGIRYLQGRPDVDSTEVGIWAVSQGGWIAPVVATAIPQVAFVILHAGPSVSPRKQGQMEFAHQLALRYPDLKEEELNTALAFQNLYFDAMKTDAAYDELQLAYAKLKNGGARGIWNPGTKEQVRAGWTAANLDFDPIPYLKQVKCPVLAFFGEKDSLVPPEGNLRFLAAALDEAGNKDVTIKVLPGVNHNFQLPGRGIYGFQSSGKTPEGYYDVMISWLSKHHK